MRGPSAHAHIPEDEAAALMQQYALVGRNVDCDRRSGQARALRAQAHVIVADIAARLDRTELRATFLELAQAHGAIGSMD